MDQGWILDGWEQSGGSGDSRPRPQAKGMLVEQYTKLEWSLRERIFGVLCTILKTCL